MKIESLTSSFPLFKLMGVPSIFENGFYYSKNLDSEYIDCSENTAAALNLASLKDIKGKRDQNFGWSKQRIAFLRSHDLEVINNQKSIFKIEQPFTLANGKIIQLVSIKFPLIINKKMVGISGISFDLKSNRFSISNNNILTKPDTKQLLTVLSQREQQCLRYFLNGKTAKETAMILGLSYRTIEEYLTNLKKKLGCRTKRDLLALMSGL